MSTTTTCNNPRCTCSPCTCIDCRCGTVRLGHLEQRVMEVVWERSDQELTGRAVADRLPGYAYTTVATVLDRLSNKGLLRRRLEGRTVRFAPVNTQGDHGAQLMREALQASSHPDVALVRFAETMSLDQAEILRQALPQPDGRSKKARRR